MLKGLKNKYSSDIFRQLFPLISLIVVCAFFGIASRGELFSAVTIKAFPNYAFQVIIPACGLALLMSQGELDFAMAAEVTICAALGAMASKISPWLAIAVAISAGLLMGFINSIFTIWLGISSFIATLAASFMYGGLASVLLGGGALIADYSLKKGDILWLKYMFIVLSLMFVLVVLKYTPFGKYCCAIGARSEVAKQSGISMTMVKMIPFLICGISCSIEALFVLARTCSASTTSGGSTQMNALLALLLGGVPFSGGWASKFRCVLLGSLLMSVITYGFSILNISARTQQVAEGLLFVIAVALSFDRKNTAVIK